MVIIETAVSYKVTIMHFSNIPHPLLNLPNHTTIQDYIKLCLYVMSLLEQLIAMHK